MFECRSLPFGFHPSKPIPIKTHLLDCECHPLSQQAVYYSAVIGQKFFDIIYLFKTDNSAFEEFIRHLKVLRHLLQAHYPCLHTGPKLFAFLFNFKDLFILLKNRKTLFGSRGAGGSVRQVDIPSGVLFVARNECPSKKHSSCHNRNKPKSDFTSCLNLQFCFLGFSIMSKANRLLKQVYLAYLFTHNGKQKQAFKSQWLH